MIRYALRCDQGHSTEAWFNNAATFDRLSESGLLSCEICGSAKIRKAPMAPAVIGASRRSRGPLLPLDHPDAPAPSAPAGAPAPVAEMLPPAPPPPPIPQEVMLRAKLEAMRHWLRQTHQGVGERFAEEARAMHRGEIPERPIYGKASGEDVTEMLDEGIAILPIPFDPETGSGN